MTALSWLACANAALWLGLGFYLALLAKKQKELEKRAAASEGRHE